MDAVPIRLESISKRFRHPTRGEVFAVRDVSLDVPSGQFLTLLGPSGCGKTTTLRMIAGFEEPTAGRIRFGDTDVTAWLASRRNIGFVFQNYALFPHLPVFENVAYGLRVRRRSGAEIARAVAEVLELVGLAGHERQFPHQLSGGEQQRVALARAIVIRPQVLLLDEPLSNLDARLRLQMRTEIRRLQERLAITTIYVTHDQEEAMAIADRIAVMSGGGVVQVGTADDLYERPATVFVAQFVGRINLVSARVHEAHAGTLTVELGGRLFRLAAAAAGASGALPPPGRTVRLAIRPEAIELAPAASDHDCAVITSRVFLGEKAEYVVSWGGVSLQACTYAPALRRTLGVGDRVDLRVPEDAIRVFADAEPA